MTSGKKDKTPKKVATRSLSKQDELLQAQTQYFLDLEEKKLSKEEKIKKFIWNPVTREFMGRTSSSWGKFLCCLLQGIFVLSHSISMILWNSDDAISDHL